MLDLDIAYSVEEIDYFGGGYKFWTGDVISMLAHDLTDLATSCFVQLGDRVSDYGVVVDEMGGTIYIVRSHHLLPMVSQ